MNSNGDICPYCGDILPEDGSPCPACRHLHERGLPDGTDLDTVEQEQRERDNTDVANALNKAITAASYAAHVANPVEAHPITSARLSSQSPLAAPIPQGEGGSGEHLLHLSAHSQPDQGNGLDSTSRSSPHVSCEEASRPDVRRIESDGALSKMSLAGGEQSPVSPTVASVKRRRKRRHVKALLMQQPTLDRNEPTSTCIVCGTLHFRAALSVCPRCGGICKVMTLDEIDWMARLNPNLAYLPRL